MNYLYRYNIFNKKIILLIFYNIIFRFKHEKKKYFLGFLWWFIEPTIYLIAFWILIMIMNRNITLEYLVLGKFMFLWFSKCVTGISGSLIKYKALNSIHYLDGLIGPIIESGIILFKQLVYLFVLIVFFSLTYENFFRIELLLLPFLYIFTFIFIFATGLIFLILRSFYKDFENLIPPFMLFMMFSSGIFFRIEDLSSEFMKNLLINYNPLTLIIKTFREIMYGEFQGNYILNFIIIFFISLMIILISKIIIQKTNKFYEYY